MAARQSRDTAVGGQCYLDLRLGIEREVFFAVGRRVYEPLHQLLVHEDHVQLRDCLIRPCVPLLDGLLPVLLGDLCALLGLSAGAIGCLVLFQQPCLLDELWKKTTRLCVCSECTLLRQV